jgi:glycosyltransferase involved in cell wall biosynthesis
LVVVGGGNLNYVFDHIKGCWGKITLTGKISHEEVFQLYQIATIGVIPSVYEQCSYVALEMMKYGLPVVVADAPGLNELYVHGEDSLIISRHKISDDSLQMILHEDELKTALATLLTKSKQRNKFSENIRNKWERKHTAVIMGQQTLIEYSKLIQ